MYKDRQVAVIIGAAGIGKRMGAKVPKQFLKLGDQTMVEKTTRAIANSEKVDKVVVVTNEEYLKETKELLSFDVDNPKSQGFEKVVAIVAGGNERQDSIYEGIKALDGLAEDSIVLVHDGARPLVTADVIDNVIEGAFAYEAAVASVKAKDTVRQRTKEGTITLDRDSLYNVQTPQGFTYGLLKRAYEEAFKEGFYGTDDGGLVERLGHPVEIVEGSYGNIKITTKEDMPMVTRIGTGFDVHKLVPGRKLILGGVDIPFEKGLLGHSDADVLVHAWMDALLGASALGDIGKHFPDTDHAYKGISSIELLKQVAKLLEKEGYTLGNGDITLIAQRPKIAPYIAEMRRNIAQAMGVDESLINIKGTTTEKLGFTGRGEGIAAEAVCILKR